MDYDVKGDVYHNVVLAYAYAGQVAEAYRFARAATATKLTFQDPEFWYVAARLCSMVRDQKNGFYCLEQAQRLGFTGVDAAKVIPDLHFLRQSDPKRFDRLVTPPALLPGLTP
jgi:hypothetical protein